MKKITTAIMLSLLLISTFTAAATNVAFASPTVESSIPSERTHAWNVQLNYGEWYTNTETIDVLRETTGEVTNFRVRIIENDDGNPNDAEFTWMDVMSGALFVLYDDETGEAAGDVSATGYDTGGNQIELFPPIDPSQLFDNKYYQLGKSFIGDTLLSKVPFFDTICWFIEHAQGDLPIVTINLPDDFKDDNRYDIIEVPLVFKSDELVQEVSINIPLRFSGPSLVKIYMVYKARHLNSNYVSDSVTGFDISQYEEVFTGAFEGNSDFAPASLSITPGSRPIPGEDTYTWYYKPPFIPELCENTETIRVSQEASSTSGITDYRIEITENNDNLPIGEWDVMSGMYGDIKFLYDDTNVELAGTVSIKGYDADGNEVSLLPPLDPSVLSDNLFCVLLMDIADLYFGITMLGTALTLIEILTDDFPKSITDNPPEKFKDINSYDIIPIHVEFQTEVHRVVVTIPLRVSSDTLIETHVAYQPYFDVSKITGDFAVMADQYEANFGRTSYAPLGWGRYGYDLSRTGFYPHPSKYRIGDQPFETLWSSPHEGKNLMSLTGDVNGDGKLEVVKVSGDNLKVISGTGTGLWTETIPGVDSYYGTGWLQLNLLDDVTGDGVPEIFVSRKANDYQSNIYVYDGSKNRIKTLSRSVGRDGNMWAVAVFDVDNDGDKEILCGIGSNYVGNPRGACLFDYNTGTQLWYYAAGNPITDSIADLNNDGLMEITSGWWTVHNGASGQGKGSNTYTSDSSVYAIVINENGNEIYTKEIHSTHNHGGAFQKIVDLNRDGTKEVLVLHGHEPVYPGTPQIFLFDQNGNEIDSYTGSYNKNWAGAAIADVNGDGKDEIIVACNDGILRLMNYNLDVIDSANHYYGPQAVNDINGDGELEIIVTDYNTRELVVLDNDLDELWKLSFPVSPGAIVSDVNGDGVNDLVVTADQLYVVSSPSRVKLPTPIFTPSIEKVPLRFEIEPYGGIWGPGTNVHVEMYDISPRAWQSLTDLSLRAEDIFVASFDCNAFRNRDSNPELSREEVMQNIYEAIPQAVIDELHGYLPEMFVVYSMISTYNSLFADFGIGIIEGSQPSTADAFAVLAFAIPDSLDEGDWVPTYMYSKYGYLDEGAWSTLGAGFGTGDLKTVSVYCLADLQVVDSLGRTLSKELNEIPGAAYFESDLNQDGETDDTVILPEIAGLTYRIWVLPEPEAPPDETYTLVLGSIEIGITIAEDIPLSEAPEAGYQLASLFSPQETPPTTTLTIGSPQYTNQAGDIFINSSTPLTLQANPGSAGVSSTAYRIYNDGSGWISCPTPTTLYLTGLDDGLYHIDYYSVDISGNIEPTKTQTIILDNSGPLITVENPPPGWALQDGVTFIAMSTDLCGTYSLNFSIHEANGDQGIPVGFEDMPATYNTTTGKWEWFFDTLQLPDGFYIVIVSAEDNLGHAASITVPYSIRNWAVLELLPATPNNKAGRTMPIKFSIIVKASVDPAQPFIYNEELTIKIHQKGYPGMILQTSTYGTTSMDYRIDPISEKYITNFKTEKTAATYVVEIYRKDLLLGQSEFSTVQCPGDVNGDHTVNIFDVLAVKSSWGTTSSSPNWIPENDVNGDSVVNIFDILVVKADWGKSW